MKTIILVDDHEQNNENLINQFTNQTGQKMLPFDFQNLEQLKKIILTNDRTVLVGREMWKITSKLMPLKGLIVANLFCEADAVETPMFNAANVATIDLDELGLIKGLTLTKIWLQVPIYQPDGVHDQYIEKLKEWGIADDKINSH